MMSSRNAGVDNERVDRASVDHDVGPRLPAYPRTLVSYAQNREDIRLWRALADVGNGFYVDVHAASPSVHSVTKLFDETGWTGVHVEPDSTALVNAWASIPPSADVHFLNVDVSSAQEDVIASNDWSRRRPWIVVLKVVPTTSRTPIDGRAGKMLEESGYEFAYFDGMSDFYVEQSRADAIGPLLAYPISALDDCVSAELNATRERMAIIGSRADEWFARVDELRLVERRLLERQGELVHALDAVYRSASYRLGNILVIPLRPLRALSRRINGPAVQRLRAVLRLARHEGPRAMARRAIFKQLVDGRRPGLTTPPFDPRIPEWVLAVAPTTEQLESQTIASASMTTRFSVIVDGSTGSCKSIATTVRSLERQSYPHWTAHVLVARKQRRVLERLLRTVRDRVHLHVHTGDAARTIADVSRNFSSPADLVGIVTAGDQLRADALFELAQAPADAAAIYADEVAVVAGTQIYHGALLKPDWSPEMELSYHYVGRPLFVRGDRLAGAGGFAPDAGHAVEQDIVFRLSRDGASIHHVERCLYTRVASPEWPAQVPRTEAAMNDAARTVEKHLRALGIGVTAEADPKGLTHIRWREIAAPPKVSVIIPTKDRIDLLREAVDSVLEFSTYPNVELIVVDNNSTSPEAEQYFGELTRRSNCSVVPYARAFNYSEACNLGAAHASGDLLLFLNNDVEAIFPDWIAELAGFMAFPDVGCVGTQLRYPDTGSVQHAGVVVGVHLLFGLLYNGADPGRWDCFGSPATYRNALSIMGACQLVRRTAFDEVGGFDTRYRIVNGDVKLCLDLYDAGYRTVYTPYSALRHHEGATRGRWSPTIDLVQSYADIRAKRLYRDPYFHEALSPEYSVPSLRHRSDPSPEVTLRDYTAHIFGDGD